MFSLENGEKSISFVVFSRTNLSKMNVLKVLGSENIEFIFILLVFCSKSCVFNENPCAKIEKRKKVKKQFVFPEKKKSNT